MKEVLNSFKDIKDVYDKNERKENQKLKTTQQKKEEVKEEPKNTGIIRDKEGKFIKGVSGNPAGKPPGDISIVALLKRELEKCPEDMDKKTYAQLLVKTMLDKSINDRDVAMIKDVVDRVDGKPVQKQELEHSGGINLGDLLDKVKE